MHFFLLRKQILCLTKQLNIESNYPEMILLYKILCSIVKNCASLDITNIGRFLNSKPFQVALARYSHYAITKLFDDRQHLPLIANICNTIYQDALHDHPSDFFLCIAPGMVADWNTLQQIAKEVTLDVLIQLLLKTGNIAGTPQIFDCNPYQHSDTVRKLLPHATDQQIEKISGTPFFAHIISHPDTVIPVSRKLSPFLLPKAKAKRHCSRIIFWNFMIPKSGLCAFRIWISRLKKESNHTLRRTTRM